MFFFSFYFNNILQDLSKADSVELCERKRHADRVVSSTPSAAPFDWGGGPTLARGTYIGWGVPTLAEGYPPSLGVPTLAGRTYLGRGLARVTTLARGVPTLAGGLPTLG